MTRTEENGMGERGDTIEIEHRLEASRPVPRAEFRGELRRHLLTHAGTASRPARVPSQLRARLLITAYAGSGALLIAIAAIGIAGVGPLAA